MYGDILGTNRMFCPQNVPIGSRIPQFVSLPRGDAELKRNRYVALAKKRRKRCFNTCTNSLILHIEVNIFIGNQRKPFFGGLFLNLSFFFASGIGGGCLGRFGSLFP